jgi:hypothetical protein
MMTKKAAPLLAAAALTAASLGAHANEISLGPVDQSVGIGDVFSVEISMSFEEATVGGAFDLFYDPTQLSFVSFEFDSEFFNDIADPAFNHVPDFCFTDGAPFGGCDVGDPELNAIGFGNFDGISGDHLVATVFFQALARGTSLLTMAVNDAPFEGFYSAETGLEMDVIYNGASVQVVPVPAALWLLVSAVGLLGARRQRR